jgi:very-short-patch-repair endonuclease
MRFSPTASEAALWRALSGRKLGVAFKRQVPLGRFIADFLAPAVRFVVEVDGQYHGQRQRADARRDETLRRLGYRVLRLEAALVERALGVAVARIQEELGRLPG